MNITFLIGNGFDLGVGLKTSYRDFYAWYGTQPSSSDIIQQFKDNILLDIANGSNQWSDLESGLGHYASNYSLENIGNFYLCYDDIQSRLVEYLSLEEKRIDYDLYQKDIISSFKTSFLEFFTELNPAEQNVFKAHFKKYANENHFYNAIVFNYTRVFDECIDRIKTSGNVLNTRQIGTVTYESKIVQVAHVHGYTEDTPILGVNDIGQIQNEQLCKDNAFCVTMIKPIAVTATGEGWAETAEQIVAQSNIICVFGLSIGSTDLKWWRQIGQWLKASSDRKLVLFSYGKSLNKISIRSRLEVITQIKTAFLQQSGLSEVDAQKIETQIYAIRGTQKVFQLNLVPLDSKTEQIDSKSAEEALAL